MASGFNTFAERLREIREDRDMSLRRRLAEKADLSPAYVSAVEFSKVDPPVIEKIRAICKVLGENPRELFLLSGRIPEDVELREGEG